MNPLIQTALFATTIALTILAFSFWLARLLMDYPPKRLATSILNAREQATLAAAADAFFPPDGPIPLSGSDAGVVLYFDRYLLRYRPTQRLLTRALIGFTEYSPLWFGPQRSRFSQLSLRQRIDFLDRAFTSSIYFRRVAFIALRAVMTMAYLSNGEVARHMNMVRDCDPFGLGKRELNEAIIAAEAGA